MKDQNATQQNRREFIKKYGKYAAVTPIAMTTLMAPNNASAACSEGFAACQAANCVKPNGKPLRGNKLKNVSTIIAQIVLQEPNWVLQ